MERKRNLKVRNGILALLGTASFLAGCSGSGYFKDLGGYHGQWDLTQPEGNLRFTFDFPRELIDMGRVKEDYDPTLNLRIANAAGYPGESCFPIEVGQLVPFPAISMVVSYELADIPNNYINDCLEALIKDAEDKGVNYGEVAYAHFEFNFIYSLDDSGVGEFPNYFEAYFNVPLSHFGFSVED